MGLCTSKKDQGISMELRTKIIKVFEKIDINHSHSIDKAETLKFWTTNFAKLNTEALFKAVDFDKSGEITEAEWMAFWEIVKKSGHTEQEIDEELDQLSEGKAWVQLSKVDEFIKRDEKKRVSEVKIMVEVEKRKFSYVQEEPDVKRVGEGLSIESHIRPTNDQVQKDLASSLEVFQNNVQYKVIEPIKEEKMGDQDL